MLLFVPLVLTSLGEGHDWHLGHKLTMILKIKDSEKVEKVYPEVERAT